MMITVLNREEIADALDMRRVIAGVEQVYKAKAQGQTVVWPLVWHDFEHVDGAMDIRSGYVATSGVHGLKMLNNFPGNVRRGLPAFTGMMMVFDSDTGLPLGVLEASYITCMRTGAAGAVGARTLARPGSRRLMVLGAGKQAPFQIAASLILLPQLERVVIVDPLDPANARDLASALPARLRDQFGLGDADDVRFEATEDLPSAVASSDVLITVTRAREPVIQAGWVSPGTHLSCIGADAEGKEEIDPAIFRGARIFADDKPQCMRVGEMRTALERGVIGEADIAGELGQVLIGEIPGRTDDAQVTIFDATGLAPLDLVTARIAIELAQEKGIGTRVEM